MKSLWQSFVKYKEKSYALIESDGSGLFHLDDLLETPGFLEDYTAKYEIRDSRRFFLSNLQLFLDSNVTPVLPEINGIKPIRNGKAEFFYENIGLFIPFTGTLILASGVMRNPLINVEESSSWFYEELGGFVFVDGELGRIDDISEEVLAMRSILRDIRV